MKAFLLFCRRFCNFEFTFSLYSSSCKSFYFGMIFVACFLHVVPCCAVCKFCFKILVVKVKVSGRIRHRRVVAAVDCYRHQHILIGVRPHQLQSSPPLLPPGRVAVWECEDGTVLRATRADFVRKTGSVCREARVRNG